MHEGGRENAGGRDGEEERAGRIGERKNSETNKVN